LATLTMLTTFLSCVTSIVVKTIILILSFYFLRLLIKDIAENNARNLERMFRFFFKEDGSGYKPHTKKDKEEEKKLEMPVWTINKGSKEKEEEVPKKDASTPKIIYLDRETSLDSDLPEEEHPLDIINGTEPKNNEKVD